MSDELVWKRRSKGEDNWRARNAADDGTYVAGLMDSNGTTQIVGIFMPDDCVHVLDGSIGVYRSMVGVGSLAEAKDALQEHHYAACRARRWKAYMRDNEPPDKTPGECGVAAGGTTEEKR